MMINDLVMVTKTYIWKIYYLDPEKIVEREVEAGKVGIIVDAKKSFVWVVFHDAAYQIQQKHLRVIGKSTLEQFCGHPCVDWNKIVGDEHGIWLDKDVMTLPDGCSNLIKDAQCK